MKAKTESLLLDPAQSLKKLIYLLVICFLPTQLGRHFFISESYVYGLKIDYLSPTIYLTDILVGLLFLLCIPSFFLFVKKRIFPQKSVRVIVLLLTLPFLYHLILSPSVLELYAVIKCIEYSFFVYVTYWYFSTVKNKAIFVFALSLGLVFESLVSMLQFFNQSSLGGLFYIFGERTFSQSTPGIANASLGGELFLRPYGTLPHPNVLGGYLLSGVVILWFSFFQITARILKRWIYFALFLSSLALFMSLSRVAISLFIGFFIWQLFRLKSFTIHRFTIASVTLFILVIFFLTFDFVIPRFVELLSGGETILQRMQLLAAAYEMIKSSLLFGVGPMQFLRVLPDYLLLSASVFLIQPVHNIFIQAFVELGLVGFLGVILLILLMLQKLINKALLTTPLPYLFIVLFVIGNVDHYFLTLQQGQLLLALFIGMTFAHERL